jgi:three-Cys-motif partner protein
MAKRQQFGRKAWEHACSLVEAKDDLPVFSTGGMWTADKLYFVCQYLEQVARAMSANSKFPSGLRYIDLFAGCGVSVATDENRVEHRYPGSPIIAASLGGSAFKGLYLCDKDANSIDALKSRLARTKYSGSIKTWCADANQVIDEIANTLPQGSLNVAFVDPWSLDVHYETIERLARQRPVDLIILFSDRLDLQRNVDDIYYPAKNDKLDLFLGKNSNWRRTYDQLPERTGGKLREFFASIYLSQLRKLGYEYTLSWPLPGPMGPMFRLVFASKNQLGVKFCEIAKTETLARERGLFPP